MAMHLENHNSHLPVKRQTWRARLLDGRYLSQMTRVSDVMQLMEQVQNIRELTPANSKDYTELKEFYMDIRDRYYVLIRKASEKRDEAIKKSENSLLERLNKALEAGNEAAVEKLLAIA